jgi:hypothetical protein
MKARIFTIPSSDLHPIFRMTSGCSLSFKAQVFDGYNPVARVIRRTADCSIPTRSVSEGQFRRSLTYGIVDLMVTRSVSEELFVPHLRVGLSGSSNGRK